jgi:FtsP/CotA-like multicopper oxidase with cupredoxin domain
VRICVRRGRVGGARRVSRLVGCMVLIAGAVAGAGRALAGGPQESSCPRPPAGIAVPEPQDLRAEHGVLKVSLSVRNEREPDGSTRFCYLLRDGAQAPTLRMKPGELLILRLKNELSDTDRLAENVHAAHSHHAQGSSSDPCTRASMSLTSTNLHFHGLTLPPVCHQDEILRTSIQPSDPPFEYRFRIPATQPPGLYWYHPHIHGFSGRQVLGGASGALIVEGIERANPEVAGLAERVLIIRDQDLLQPDAAAASAASAPVLVDREGDAVNTGSGGGRPAKDLSVNFVPVAYPGYAPATVTLKPGERQLWRVLNASTVTYLNLAAFFKRGTKFRPQWIGVVAIDGMPLRASGSPGHATEWRDSIVVSPGARVEFIMVGPPAGVPAVLVTRTVDTGPGGENDPDRPLISILTAAEAPPPRSSLPGAATALPAPALPWLGSVQPVRVRKLYFSEDPPDEAHPGGRFYLTVEGQKPVTFDPASTRPNIIVRQGDVEDWIIENRSTEVHAFHIHQTHFEVIEWLGVPVNEPFLRDTVNVPYYTGSSAYPSVRLRVDFRDPAMVGTFVYHCHLLDHEDGGMMGLIRVEPAAMRRR